MMERLSMSARTVTEIPHKLVAWVARREPGEIGLSVLLWSAIRTALSQTWVVAVLFLLGVAVWFGADRVGDEPAPSAALAFAFGLVGGYVLGLFRPEETFRKHLRAFLTWYAEDVGVEEQRKGLLDIAAAAQMGSIRATARRFQEALRQK